jgi:hypothetical protein
MDVHSIKNETAYCSCTKNRSDYLNCWKLTERYSSTAADASHTLPKISILCTVCVLMLLNVFCKTFIVKWDVRMFCEAAQQLRERRHCSPQTCGQCQLSTPVRGVPSASRVQLTARRGLLRLLFKLNDGCADVRRTMCKAHHHAGAKWHIARYRAVSGQSPYSTRQLWGAFT